MKSISLWLTEEFHARATHLVGHHSHLRLFALSNLSVGLRRTLGLISTGHDYWVGRKKKHGEGM